MTEAEWLACTRQWKMIPEVLNGATARKLRLFACACCRSVAHLAGGPNYEAALLVLERFADGEGKESDRIRAGKWEPASSAQLNPNVDACLLGELERAAAKTPTRVARDLGESASAALGYTEFKRFQELKLEESARQATLLRDIFGNPFRPVAFDPAWRTSDAVALARSMYDSREFTAMPILADALQDAGCENEQVLNHCRDTQQKHVRGCWVCDLVLGKL